MIGNVGIINMEFYYPSLSVQQKDLENFDNVSPGKYIKGLGQTEMKYCTAREDAVSMALTCVYRLIKKSNLNYCQIGRLEVGSESNFDKSKSIKSHLMQLFEDSGNFDIEGADNLNACYGGTAALFNTIHWIESSFWNGKYGLVIATDVAIYSRESSAYVTGGAGAVALLVGPHATMYFENIRTSFMKNVYDFYKPMSNSDYPIVDGRYSIICYLESVLNCWYLINQKFSNITSNLEKMYNEIDFFIFHSPYTKLVQKAFYYLLDITEEMENTDFNYLLYIEKMKNMWDNSEKTKTFENILIERFLPEYEKKVSKSLIFNKIVGNSYTCSIFTSLFSLLRNSKLEEMLNKRILIFSYGSGLTSSMYTLRIKSNFLFEDAVNGGCVKSNNFEFIYKNLKVNSKIFYDILYKTPEQYEADMLARENVNAGLKSLQEISTENIKKETYYIEEIDGLFRRKYKLLK